MFGWVNLFFLMTKSSSNIEKIKRLEGEIQRKVQESGSNYENYMAMQRKSELTAEEIRKIK